MAAVGLWQKVHSDILTPLKIGSAVGAACASARISAYLFAVILRPKNCIALLDQTLFFRLVTRFSDLQSVLTEEAVFRHLLFEPIRWAVLKIKPTYQRLAMWVAIVGTAVLQASLYYRTGSITVPLQVGAFAILQGYLKQHHGFVASIGSNLSQTACLTAFVYLLVLVARRVKA